LSPPCHVDPPTEISTQPMSSLSQY
jgi:hypothetical protein